ncbi:condensation domain-containing protein [Tistrella bauzanensis]
MGGPAGDYAAVIAAACGAADDRRLAGDLAWWTGRLGHEHPEVLLPVDHTRRGGRGTSGRQVSRTLPADLVARLASLSHARGATPVMALLAAFNALLHRIGGQQDIRVGVAVAGRGDAARRDLTGFFVDTLVLRTDITPAWASMTCCGGCATVCWMRRPMVRCRSRGWYRPCSPIATRRARRWCG